MATALRTRQVLAMSAACQQRTAMLIDDSPNARSW